MVYSYKELITPTEQDKIKHNIQTTLRLAKLVSEFLSKFTEVYERFYKELDSLVTCYQHKTKECVKDVAGTSYDQSSLKTAWQTLLHEVGNDVRGYADFTSKVNKTGHNRLIEIVGCKKLQMREMLEFRHHIDTMLDNSEETLHKLRIELRQASHNFDTHRHHFSSMGTNRKDKALASCIQSHNDYLMEIESTNQLIETYHTQSLPWVLQELEDVHKDTASSVTSTIQNFALLTVSRTKDQSRRYDSVFNVCNQLNVNNDIHNFVRALKPDIETDSLDSKPKKSLRRHVFQPTSNNSSVPECLKKEEMIFDKLIEDQLKDKRQRLLQENLELSRLIEEAEEDVTSLTQDYNRLLAGTNYSKVYDTQVELCSRKKSLNMARLRVCVVQSQIESLRQKSVTIMVEDDQSSRRPTSTSTNKPTIKTMWKKFAKKASTTKKKNKNGESSSPHMSDAGIDITLSTDKDPQPANESANADPVYNLLKSASTLRRSTADGDSSGVSSMRSLPRQNTASSGRSGSSRSSSPGAGFPSRQSYPQQNELDGVLHVDSPNLRPFHVSYDGSGSSEITLAPERKIQDSPQRRPQRHPMRWSNQSELAECINVEKARTTSRRQSCQPVVYGGASTGWYNHRNLSPQPSPRTPRSANRRFSLQTESRSHTEVMGAESEGIAAGVRTYGVGARPRQMLNKRVKSFSLDAPDVPKPVDSSTKVKSTSYTNNTCIPGVNSGPAHGRRRIQLMSEHRGLSVDLDDRTTGSHLGSNASIPSNHSSPRSFPPRPVPQARTSVQAEGGQLSSVYNDNDDQEYLTATLQRSGPNNDVFIALYEFTAENSDDLPLRPGCRVAPKDTSDPDWWFGSADGKTGYFPTRYILPLRTGQKAYQVCKPLHLTTANSEMRLLRDQVVIECGTSDRTGMMLIQTKNIKTGHVYEISCPQRYLTEI